MKKDTRAIHTPYPQADAYNALAMPVYHTAAYEFADADAMADAFCGRTDAPNYSRVANPTVSYFEQKIRSLTDATEVVAFSSGMAAISNLLIAIAAEGKNIVLSRHLFGNTFSLITRSLLKFGVKPKLCDLTDLDAVARAVDENTCCVFLEIITNPQMEVADLEGLARIAHEHNVPLVADTTTIPFTEFSAKELGVDVEVVSTTKYISGGATSLGGVVINYDRFPAIGNTLRHEMLYNFGAYMSPHVAYMQTLGLETLGARYKAQASGALQLAKRLTDVSAIKRVNYVGLPDNPYYDLAQRQFGPTAGAMLTIDLADREACYSFINKLKIIRRATNLYDNRSLAIHPASTIFGLFNDRQRQQMDVRDTTIRLSIGLEDVDDLFEDICQALDS